jgi:hypothetical protein
VTADALDRAAKIKDKKLVGERFYVARLGKAATAHGKTIREALSELRFKTGERYVEAYRNMPLTTRKSVTKWVEIYRLATGACQLGTKMFLEQANLQKKSYTLTEVLAETKGQYGHDEFKNTVAGKL